MSRAPGTPTPRPGFAEVLWTLTSHHGPDFSEYTVGVIRDYVDDKRAEGTAEHEIGELLDALEGRAPPRYAQSFSAVRWVLRLPSGRRAATMTPRPKSPPARYSASSPAPRPHSIASTFSQPAAPAPPAQPDLFYRVSLPAGTVGAENPPVIRTPEDVVALLRAYGDTNAQYPVAVIAMYLEYEIHRNLAPWPDWSGLLEVLERQLPEYAAAFAQVRFVRYIGRSPVLPFDWPPYARAEEPGRAAEKFFAVTPPHGFVDELFEKQPPPMLRTPEAVLRCLEAFQGGKDEQYPVMVLRTYADYEIHRNGTRWRDLSAKLEVLEAQAPDYADAFMIVRYVYGLLASPVLKMDWPPRFRIGQGEGFYTCYPAREDSEYRYRVGEPPVLRSAEDVIECLSGYVGPVESQFPATVFSTYLQWIAHREGGAWTEWGQRLTYLEGQLPDFVQAFAIVRYVYYLGPSRVLPMNWPPRIFA
ncbi:hypothetical protein Q8F55_008169 [Vanrija albida]|uniref:Uncharacterized protein n=1 Tax=Vanrija albida TaxID=181172 RepID=A0ABR3PVH6_9TREE